jgi:hypothetical protein
VAISPRPRERTPELPLSRRDEMLADLVLALSGSTVEGEIERLHRELSEDAELAAWIDFTYPGASAQLRARIADHQGIFCGYGSEPASASKSG